MCVNVATGCCYIKNCHVQTYWLAATVCVKVITMCVKVATANKC